MFGSFVHLHTHSSHSVRDSIAHPDDLFAATANDGQSALAIADHGNLSGLYVAYKSAKSHDVKLITGLEAYMAIESGSLIGVPATAIRVGRQGDLW
jgi:DNA polymerase-3 subunit alpha